VYLLQVNVYILIDSAVYVMCVLLLLNQSMLFMYIQAAAKFKRQKIVHSATTAAMVAVTAVIGMLY
jgi:hypothetical protein